ncbi:MAG: glycine cleavage system aminomethyltransferase GcvT [Deltaproteobacteria bacterium]|nr:glycine cleavage system aminomethyltransferase GcvT [Deltaproteobacteria bacterium]
MTQARKTPYYDMHVEQGAKMVEFASWIMPMQYDGIKKEHMAVRTAAGLFDVAHMGEILFQGDGALETVNRLITNDLNLIPDNHALYTPICYENGGIVDDCIVYKRSHNNILIVVNASNKDKDFKWMKENAVGIAPVDESEIWALLAIQGPNSEKIMKAAFDADLSDVEGFGLGYFNAFGKSIMVARTGYTGEDGFEIFFPSDLAVNGYKKLIEAGKDFGLVPAGLGARDTLRLEAKLWLYGNDISAETNPVEAGMNFTLKFENHDFIGKEAILREKEMKPGKKLIGFKAVGKGIPREHFKIFSAPSGQSGIEIGMVTSGTKVPYLNESVGMGYVESAFSKSGTRLWATDSKGREIEIELVRGPFYKRK